MVKIRIHCTTVDGGCLMVKFRASRSCRASKNLRSSVINHVVLSILNWNIKFFCTLSHYRYLMLNNKFALAVSSYKWFMQIWQSVVN